HWATVGSSNIDPFSLMLAREANAVVEDRRFGAELRAKLRADIEHGARVVARTRWFRQPLRRRIPMWIGYGLARLAVGVFGSVEKGNTVCDFDPLEKEYKHSLNSALVNFAWKNVHIHLIDTPGSPDFMGQAIGALAAVETAAIVVNAETGIQLATDRMLKWAAKRNLCRMIVSNRIDAENADLEAMLARIQQAVWKQCLP